jgi:hypothetical protein
LGGVVVDEAAHLDLENALRNVLRPALMDRGGWLLLVSTPYAGSYFNAACKEIMAGARGPDWAHWHGTPFDNPSLDRAEVEALIAEYPPDSPQVKQEIYADLLEGGAGLMFPHWRSDLHVQTMEPPAWARWFAGLDWGYSSLGALVLCASADDRLYVRYDISWREQTPREVGRMLALRLGAWPLRMPEWVAADSACWSVSDGGPTVAEGLQAGLKDVLGSGAPPLISAPKGPGSRVAGWLQMQQALRWSATGDGEVKVWQRPHAVFHPEARYLIRTIPVAPRDEKKPEDLDTDSDDHGLDAFRYALMSREPVSERPEQNIPQDVHPGFLLSGKRRSRVRDADTVAREEIEDLVHLGQSPGGRYGMRGVDWY